MRFEGKIALITGASGGIGRAIATKLAAEGARIAVHYGGSKGKAEETLAAVEAAGGQGALFQADISVVSDIQAMFAAIIDQFGRLDILINNAGMGAMAPIAKVTEDEYDRMFAVNTKGYFFCLQEAAKCLADGGRIVNIASGTAQASRPGIAVYGATRAAVQAFTRAAAQELAPRGIVVNSVSPGPVTPGIVDQLPQEQLDMLKKANAFGRIGRADEIAATVAFLASQDCSWIAGQDLAADGGRKN